MFAKAIRLPLLALFFISLGGLLLHLRIHPPSAAAENWIPVLCGLVTTFVLPFMFNNAKTATWAYLLNWAAVIVGTITMAHYSVEHWQGAVTLKTLVLNSTLADILILAAKIPLGHMILRHWRSVKSGAAG